MKMWESQQQTNCYSIFFTWLWTLGYSGFRRAVEKSQCECFGKISIPSSLKIRFFLHIIWILKENSYEDIADKFSEGLR